MDILLLSGKKSPCHGSENHSNIPIKKSNPEKTIKNLSSSNGCISQETSRGVSSPPKGNTPGNRSKNAPKQQGKTPYKGLSNPVSDKTKTKIKR